MRSPTKVAKNQFPLTTVAIILWTAVSDHCQHNQSVWNFRILVVIYIMAPQFCLIGYLSITPAAVWNSRLSVDCYRIIVKLSFTLLKLTFVVVLLSRSYRALAVNRFSRQIAVVLLVFVVFALYTPVNPVVTWHYLNLSISMFSKSDRLRLQLLALRLGRILLTKLPIHMSLRSLV